MLAFMNDLILIGLLIQAFIVCIMLAIGMQLLPGALAEVLRRRDPLWRALLINLAAVPLLGWAYASWLVDSPALSAAVLLLAASPGAPFAPRIVELSRGHLPFAVTIVLVLAVLAVFFGPLFARQALAIAPVSVSGAGRLILLLILFQLLPLLAGSALRLRRPARAVRLVSPVHLLSNLIIALIALLVLVFYREQVMQIGLADLGRLLFITLVWMAAGWLLGGKDPALRRSQALIAPARNIGMAFLMALGGFGDQEVLLLLMAQGGISLGILPVIGRWGGGIFTRRETKGPAKNNFPI